MVYQKTCKLPDNILDKSIQLRFLLDLLALLCYNQGGRGKSPGVPCQVGERRFWKGGCSLFTCSFIMRFTLSQSSSSVWHFSISLRIALSSVSVTFISFMFSLRFIRGCLSLPYIYIIHEKVLFAKSCFTLLSEIWKIFFDKRHKIMYSNARGWARCRLLLQKSFV